MKRHLPNLAIFAFFALFLTIAQIKAEEPALGRATGVTSPSPPPAGAVVPRPGDDGAAILDQAIFKLESRHSIAADISHEVNLFGERLVGTGKYYEQRSGARPRVRMELTIPFGDRLGGMPVPADQQTGTLVRVCDGRYLWTYRRVLDDGKLSRVDLDQVEKAIEESKTSPQVAGLDGLAGAGGLSRVLRGLQRSFRFTVLGETTLLQTPVWSLRGEWRPERLVKLLPGQKEAIQQGRGVKLEKLPDHLPDHVILLLGKQDFFPHRFEYRRSRSTGQGRDDEVQPIVIMELLNVNINLPVDPSLFDYHPSGIADENETDNYLETLGIGKKK
jgi:hypothetical protein